jgi:F420-dependent oxidoreductase-like protein
MTVSGNPGEARPLGGGGLRFGICLAGACRERGLLIETAQRAERLGFDSLWSSEAWGWDAFSPLNVAAAMTSTIRLGTAIAQIAARTPTALAMAALTTQAMSEGRLLLGLGVSGPQVVEGWHGVPFEAPVASTREYLQIVRMALAGEKVEFQGARYGIPYRGEGGTGLGRALRSSMPAAPEIPLLVAAMGPKNVAMAVDQADGLLPYLWSPTHWSRVWGEVLAKAPDGFLVMPTVLVSMGSDLAACRDAVRPRLALHIGGMGSRDRNYYADLVRRYGYAEVDKIQDLFLSGDRAGAAQALPDALVDDLALVGPVDHVRQQVAHWRHGPLHTLILEPTDAAMLEAIAQAVLE